MQPEGSLLIADLGGTRARIALASAEAYGYTSEAVYNSEDHASPMQAIEAYLESTDPPSPAAVCLAVAGPVHDGVAQFLNRDWRVDVGTLRKRFPEARITLVNDFQAVAWSVPLLQPQHCKQLGDAALQPDWDGEFTIGLIGPGTGLGVSGLMGIDGRLRALSSEGGHHGFAPETELQLNVLSVLRKQFSRVSDERLLSGPGLENIYRAVQEVNGQPVVKRSAAEIFERADAFDGSDNHGVDTTPDEHASMACDLFFEILGQVAGNLALTLGAKDGVFLAGGIAIRYPGRLDQSLFRAGFENKGRHRGMMETIPTALITHPQPGLLGAAFLAHQSLKD